MSAVSNKLTPASRHWSTSARASSSCVSATAANPPTPPNDMAPNESAETPRPVSPSSRISIVASGSDVEDVVQGGEAHQLHRRVQPELLQDALAMGVDSLAADGELRRDEPRGQAAHEQAEHLALAQRQRAERTLAAPLRRRHQPGRQ